MSCLLIFSMCGVKEHHVTTSSKEALALYQEGVALAEKFYDEAAIEKFRQAVSLDSTFVMAYYYMSRSYESLGNLADAEKYIGKAVQFSGTTTPLEWNYAAAWEKILAQDYSGAVDILNDVFEDSPNDRHALFVIGKTYYLMNKNEKSLAALKKLIRLEPGYAPAYNQLGYIYREIGETEMAIETFEKYIALAPDEANPYDSLGDLYRANGENEKAIELYKKALKAKPDFHTSFRNLGLSYLSSGRYDDAIATYRQYLEKFTDRSRQRDAYTDLAQVYLAKGQLSLALEAIENAISLSESKLRKAAAIAAKGQVYFTKQDYHRALNFFNASLTVYPESIWGREGRGKVFVKMRQFGDAIAEADKMKIIIDKYGVDSFYRNYFSLMGDIAMHQGLYDESIMYYSDAMKYDVYDYSCHRCPLAEAYFRKGNTEKAIEVCNEILSYNDNHAMTRFLLAQIFEDQNKTSLAKKEYKKLNEIWDDADKDLPELRIVKKML